MTGSDDPDATAENLRRVLGDFAPDATAAPPMRQVHGADVARVGADDAGEAPIACDAQVTDAPDLVLAVRVADCVPVLLADAGAGVTAVAHAGRKGLVADVVGRAVAEMRACGAEDVTGWVGPHVCGRCYEVPAEMQAAVAAQVPEARATTSWSTPALDLGAGVRAQLEARGVLVHDVGRCTRESADLYSFRRDGDRAGRSAGLITLRSRP